MLRALASAARRNFSDDCIIDITDRDGGTRSRSVHVSWLDVRILAECDASIFSERGTVDIHHTDDNSAGRESGPAGANSIAQESRPSGDSSTPHDSEPTDELDATALYAAYISGPDKSGGADEPAARIRTSFNTGNSHVPSHRNSLSPAVF